MLSINYRPVEAEAGRRLAKNVMRNHGRWPFSKELWRHESPVVPMAARREAADTRRLRDYLDSLVLEGAVSAETADRAWYVWEGVSRETERSLPVPDAASGPSGELLLTWDSAAHHLELEFLSDGTAEFFFRDRKIGTIWGEAYHTNAPLSSEVRKKLTLFR